MCHKMFSLVKIWTVLCLFTYCQASPVEISPRADEDVVYRLPSDVKPVSYKVDLILAEDAFTTQKFSGVVTIEVTTGFATASNKKEIKLHAKNITIHTIQLTKAGNADDLKPTFDQDELTNILTIKTTEDLADGTYTIVIDYEAILSDTTMHGFYKSSYTQDGETKYLATTQFESTNAREAFPSFDEPAFKATFTVSLTYPKAYKALSNTPPTGSPTSVDANLEKVTFKTTPIMSTYLVAFIVSEFLETGGLNVDNSIPTSVYSRRDAQSSVGLAVEVAPKSVRVMEDYTGYRYGDSGIGKLAQVAIPDFAAGAMENWGLITFREADLLWEENESSDVYRQTVVTVVTHELSHQWFGDLVTLDWWSDVFLNEGFASYFEYYASGAAYPELDLEQQFAIEELQAALQYDTSTSALALSSYVETPAEISNRFDDISYDKGGSILRMVHHFLTLDNFKAGLTHYIDDRKTNNANPTQLWDKLSDHVEGVKLPENIGVTAIMEAWTNKPGFPLLTVTKNGDDAVITQESFANSSDETQWYVPITYSTSEELSFDTETKDWLVPSKNLTISGAFKNSDWIILNNQQHGFYRINYDFDLWKEISEALQGNYSNKIHPLNKAQFVDDLFALAKAGKKTYSDAFDLISFLNNEDSYYPWYSAFNGFRYLLDRVPVGVQQALSEYLLKLMGGLYESLSFAEDNHIFKRKKILALTWACELGSAECIAKSKALFASFKNNTKIEPNLRSIAYCNALRNSDNISDDWKFLWQKYTEASLSTEQVTILRALGCTTDKDTLVNYLAEIVKDDSQIRLQDASIAFSSVYNTNREGVDVILDFITQNYTQIIKRFGDNSNLNSLIGSVAGKFTTDDQVNRLNTFAESTDGLDDVKKAASNAVESAKSNLSKYKDLEKQLGNYLGGTSASVSNRAGFLLPIIAAVTIWMFKSFFN